MDPIKHLATACLVAGLALASTPAAAAPGERPYGPCDGAYAAVSGLTDYRFDGFSESNHAPTWQATAYCYDNAGYFVGTTLTGVDFEDTPRTHVEADWYAGRQIGFGRYSATVTLLAATFPDQRTHGASYDLVEPEADVWRAFGRLTLKAHASWSVSATSQAWQLKGSAAYQLTPWLKLEAQGGRVWPRGGPGYEIYDVAASATWRRLTLAAHYGGTTRRVDQCYFTDWCEPGAALAATYRLLP